MSVNNKIVLLTAANRVYKQDIFYILLNILYFSSEK